MGVRPVDPETLQRTNFCGTPTAEFIFFNGNRTARLDLPSAAVHYYFSDHLGSASVVTSSTGTIQDESDYYPFGGERTVTNTDPNQYKFTAKERDSESNLDFFGARYYSSALGRFAIPDWSATATAVPYADFTDPQSLNLYGYVRNSPLSHADADGHCCDSPWDNSMVIQSYRANSTQFKADLLIGAAKEVVNSVTSTINLLTSSPMPGVYAPGSGTNIPQLEMSNEAQFLSAVAADVAMIAAPFLGEEGTAARGTNILANAEKGAASKARVLNDLGVA